MLASCLCQHRGRRRPPEDVYLRSRKRLADVAITARSPAPSFKLSLLSRNRRLPRAFARIRYRTFRWSRGSIDAGRVANRSISAQATPPSPPPIDYYFPFGEPSLLISTLSSKDYLPSSPVTLGQGQPLADFLASLHPPASLAGPPPSAPPQIEADNATPTPPPSSTAAVSAEATADAGQSFEPAIVLPPLESYAAVATAEAASEPLGFAEQIAASTLTSEDVSVPSHQVYILGGGVGASFIAHSLAGLPRPYPAPRLLFSSRDHMRNWAAEGSCISLHVDGRWVTRGRVEAQRLTKLSNADAEEPIRNLIITTPCYRTADLVRRIRHRISPDTTVCLVQDGLGVMEELNETIFKEPWSRPSYVLGSMGHELASGDRPYTIAALRSKWLSITAVNNDHERARARRIKGPQRQSDVAHFLRLLTTAPGLRAHGSTYQQWLLRRLPDLVFDSVVEPVSAVLDLPYRLLPENIDARAMIRELVGEATRVLGALPVVRARDELAEYVQSDRLLKQTVSTLRKRGSPGPEESEMGELIRGGLLTDIDYQAGWFLRQGEEAGVDCPQLRTMVRLVKAKGYASRCQRGEVEWDTRRPRWTGRWRSGIGKGEDEGESIMWPSPSRRSLP